MPELPEVETTKRGISTAVLNKQILDVVIRRANLRYPIPKIIREQLIKSSFSKITRRSKYLIFESENGHMILHLGMSGNLRLIPKSTAPQKHDHVDFIFEDCCLRYTDPRRFGAILWTEQDPEQHKLLISLGPEPLTTQFHGAHLFKLAQRHSLAVKSFIMDSKIVVGVGNIYASEALFLAKIHPHQAANKITLEQYEALAKAIKNTLKKAIKAGGTTLKDFYQSDGKPGYFRHELQVYDRAGEKCYDCKGLIQKTITGQRATYFCESCQKVDVS